MALPGSGAISIGQIATEFGGGAPHSLSEYYRNGALVPNYTQNSGIATSGAINMNGFHGASDVAPYANWATYQTTGNLAAGKTYAEVGYLAGSFGGMDDTTVNGQSNTTISAAYYRTGIQTASFTKLTLANGSNNWTTFRINNTYYARTAASKSGTTWTWGNGTAGSGGGANPYPSGSSGQRIYIAIYI